MALINEHPGFAAWRQQWTDRPRRWWRVLIVFVAFVGGLVAVFLPANLWVLPWLKSSLPDASPFFKEIVRTLMVGLGFAVALLAFLGAKNRLHGSSPSVIAARPRDFRIPDAVVSGLLWLALFLVSNLAGYGPDEMLQRLGTYTVPQWLLLGLAMLVCIGIQATTEELVFRGYLLPLLASSMGVLAAALISMLVFTVGHPGSGVAGTLAVALFAAVAAFAVVRTGSVACSAGAHVSNNFAMFLLFPEATNDMNTFADLGALAVAALVWLAWVAYTARRGRD